MIEPVVETKPTEPEVPEVPVEKQLEEALSQFAITYLRLGDLMTHVQALLTSARPMGKSGQQVAVLTSALEKVHRSFNQSAESFSPGSLRASQKKAVDMLITEIRGQQATPTTPNK